MNYVEWISVIPGTERSDTLDNGAVWGAREALMPPVIPSGTGAGIQHHTSSITSFDLK